MAHKDFWKKWSGNFPLTISYKDEDESSVFPKGVEVKRYGNKVFLTQDDVRDITKMFPEENIEPHSNLGKALSLVEDITKLRAVQKAVRDMFARRELEGGVKAAFDHPLYLQAQARIEELEEALIILI